MSNKAQWTPRRFLKWSYDHPLSIFLFALGLFSSGWGVSRLGIFPYPVGPSVAQYPDFGQFPRLNDPFHFMPCTSKANVPKLDDIDALGSWSRLFDPDPSHWSWGSNAKYASQENIYSGRGIYLCGYLDVPLDYTNNSDHRITRLAVTKYQVSGLARNGATEADAGDSRPWPGSKSNRTIVVNPGGPGVGGGRFVWKNAEILTNWLSDGEYDVLGWDPRGVNASLPAVSCFPHNINRDHWSMAIDRYLEAAPVPREQIKLMDALNQATFMACRELYGDFPRFVSTAFVARDLEQIRLGLGEDDLTAYFSSYGTGIGQIYANMYPERVGRIVMDGVQNTRDQRTIHGFGSAALKNITHAWRDGFLRECIKSGPDRCALADSHEDFSVTLDELRDQLDEAIWSLLIEPIPAFSRAGGPTVITYSSLVMAIYVALYNPGKWPRLAEILNHFLEGNYGPVGEYLEEGSWSFDPMPIASGYKSSTVELAYMVICGDSADAPLPSNGLEGWLALWGKFSAESWIGGSPRFWNVLPCKHFREYWSEPPELYRGNLSSTLKHPVLLISATHDPATPLSNGRRLAEEMGPNARLVVHHGYGHTSQDRSECTDTLAADLIRYGKVPQDSETHCFADGKPFL